MDGEAELREGYDKDSLSPEKVSHIVSEYGEIKEFSRNSEPRSRTAAALWMKQEEKSTKPLVITLGNWPFVHRSGHLCHSTTRLNLVFPQWNMSCLEKALRLEGSN